MMKDKFDVLLDEYLRDTSLLVDSNKKYYIEFVKELPEYLYRFFPSDKYLIKSSIGVGQRSEIPWLCIFNKKVTTSATQGIYLCYLFKKNMTGFYLVLGQGITTFDELYGHDKYKNIKKVAEYFRNIIDDDKFSKANINLGGNKPLAKGYEDGTIVSKYYEIGKYEENDLLKDLSDLKKIYDEICDSLMNEPYMNIVNNVVSNLDPSFMMAEEATKEMERGILEATGLEKVEIITLSLIDIPEPSNNKYSVINKKTIKKIDYADKAKTNAKNGYLGEKLVFEYEKERLIKLGRSDLVNQMRWVAKEDDSTGFDIISYDVDDKGNAKEKYIEVKTTEGKDKNVFFVSANELYKFNELKNQYYIYRVCNVKSKNPELFILDYNDFNHRIKLDVANYKASIKQYE